MIECKICGHKVKYRLIEHIIKKHKMSVDEYKIKYGDVVSDEYKKKVSEKSKEKWKDNNYRNKTLNSRSWIYDDIDLQNKRKKSIKDFYDNGGSVWNKGLTKEDDDRIKNIGIKNKELLTGRNKNNYDYLKKHSELMKSKWETSELKYTWDKIQNDDKLKEEWKKKISETISSKIINGEINPKSYNSGWYSNTTGKHWYSSILEKETMELFDELNIIWKKDPTKIKYQDIKGNEHYYIPDFQIIINNKNIIIEMKGWDWDGLTEIKKQYTEKIYEYYIFYNINELKKFLLNY